VKRSRTLAWHFRYTDLHRTVMYMKTKVKVKVKVMSINRKQIQCETN